ncbi:MAG: serine/threonine protein kinase [Hydrogenophilales bacterium 16-64-46]|nr:MAG: serine/threonine protein kinase [Hydrogenophilales bacterium 12-64-13]OYZ04885.1 MAG: serine/threonine protein kinase [Hydrogenophilales bacterium 16-64-46]OZA37528.1 MAG: serine/threonine protein kinase [Hydrogenophilales bacterium 17-64-34]HQT00713.1 serine/threonine-protein kinase [Thiobacillus sp.]
MKIGRYEILGEIGQGAMGTVYWARDPLIEREVAIKAVPTQQLREEGTEAETRFLREARSAGRLSHPSIVTIYDVGETASHAYISMEFLSGAPLRDLMDRRLLPLSIAVDTAQQMADALAFAHEHGVVHRDIKPSNVVVTGEQGRVKLTDFGIAHLLNSKQTQVGQMFGSPRYMSPEQARGLEIDGRSDIFSLGAVLYEMLTGRYAFDGDSLPSIVYSVINEAPDYRLLDSSLPPELTELLARMLHKQPACRPDAREVAQSLAALVQPGTPVANEPVRPLAPLPGQLRLLAFIVPLGVLLLVGIGMIVIQHFLPTPDTPPAAPFESGRQVKALTPSPTVAAEPAPVPLQPYRFSPPKPKPPPPVSSSKDPYLEKLDASIMKLRISRTELRLRFTDAHPDIVQIDRQLEQLDQERRKHLQLVQDAPR